MNQLFFTEADICLKDHRALQDRFTSADDFEKFVKRENQRVFFHIEKIKEKRSELIKNLEREQSLIKKKAALINKHRQQLSENQRELKHLEEQLKKEESEMKSKRAKEEDQLRLTTSTMRKNKSMINLKAVKAKIDNSPMLPSKTKDYFELQGKIKKIRDILELSENSKNIIRSRQQRDLESLIFSELKLKVASAHKKKQQESTKKQREKIEATHQKLDEKQKKLEENLQKLEEDRLNKIRLRELDRESKLKTISRVHKALDHQNEVKKEKIREEEQRIEQMKKQLDVFKEERLVLKQMLLDDLEQVRDGDRGLEEVKNRLVESMSPDKPTEERSLTAHLSLKSTPSKSSKKGLQKVRKICLLRRRRST
jgi:hypothetical protein